MTIVRIVLFFMTVALSLVASGGTAVAANYEESLKQLAEGVVAEAVKAKKHRLAFLDFTDSKGTATPIGQFLAEELGTQVLVGGELQVVERTLVQSTLRKLHIERIGAAQPKAVRRAAKAMRAEVFISGSYVDTAEGVQVTTKLISPLNAQVVGAARGTLPKAGPLAEMIKDAAKTSVVKVDAPKEQPPPGLGSHRNEWYELVVQSIATRDHQAKLTLALQNRSGRDLKILCLLQATLLKDDQGKTWAQGVEDNRDGLCTRGLELSPRETEHAVLTFTAPSDATASHFTLHYHEKSPRRDAAFVIDGLKADPAASLPASP